MADNHAIQRYRRWYARLVRCYPAPYYQRYGEGMEQTFTDLCREREKNKQLLGTFILSVFVETSRGIIREINTDYTMNQRNIFLRPMLLTAGILLIPYILTVLNPQSHLRGGAGGGWDWGPLDFLIMIVLLFGASLTFEFIARKVRTTGQRVIIGIGITFVVLAIWAQFAVDAVSRMLQTVFG